METSELENLGEEFKKARQDYEFWTTGGRCQPGSDRWHEVTAKYNAARDAYQLGLEQYKLTSFQKEKNDLLELDHLTQICTRAQFDKDLLEFVVAATAETPVSLIMMDIDDFKAVNDTYGHSVGDQVLQKIASVVRGSADLKGRAYRWGERRWL